MKRCKWVNNNPTYIKYHDTEWGVSVDDDKILFELLILEGAQAGLSWETVLMKRDNYRRIFFNYDIEKIISLSDNDLEEILKDPGIIRNRLKVYSVKKNAIAFKELQKEFGSFKNYLNSYVDKKINNNFKDLSELPAETEISKKISKDLKKRGMNFVGPTIIYAFMQAVGMVNDHEVSCFRHKEC